MRQNNINYTTAEKALSCVQNGHRIFLHGSAATPLHLLRALVEQKDKLSDIELVAISTYGDGIFNQPGFSDTFYINSLFVSANIRKQVNSERGDYIPVFLSEIPRLFTHRILPLDVAMVHVSPPDKHGFCSLGVSVDVALAAVRSAEFVIAQVNPKMPRTHGDGLIHVSHFNALVPHEEELPEVDYSQKITDISMAIGKNCAELIEDGSTLQLGIGNIPDAVLACLHNHKDLGLHTEMFSNGVLPLVESGVINNKFKAKHRGKLVTGFAVGSRKLYDFVDDNPEVVFLDIAYVNDAKVICTNPKVISINSAVEIDITGQVCADSIGTYQYSGVGGQMDFVRGASLSEGGKPIIAIASTTGKGRSKIVPYLQQGAGVVTTRAHVHYVVTEYGVAYLYGKNMIQRAREMIRIAHPDHREALEKEAKNRFYGFK